MRFRLSLLCVALALTVGFPLVSIAAESSPKLERVVIDSASSAVVSVDSSSAPLEIVLLPDPLDYRPVHPDLAADRSEDVSLTDPAVDQPADGAVDHP
jgi:hypothetical protein